MARESKQQQIERLEKELERKEQIIKDLIAENFNKDKELRNAEKRQQELIKACQKDIQKLKNENEKLKEQSGGRPSKLTEEEKASVEMYRLQGKKIKEIAKMFNCSTRTIDRVLRERKEGDDSKK